MLTMIYPVHGSTDRNLKITLLPAWTARFISKKISFLPAFLRLWMAPHFAPIVRSTDDLWRFDALIAQYGAMLEQQKPFPFGGIGWWIERKASLKTKCEQDILAYGAYIASFGEDAVRKAVLVNISESITDQYISLLLPAEFKRRVWDAATAIREGGK
jgi:hypothetical protein